MQGFLQLDSPPPFRFNIQSLEYCNHDLFLLSAHRDVGHYVYLSLHQIPAEAFDMSICVLLKTVFKSHKIVTCSLDLPDFLYYSSKCGYTFSPIIRP
jgi:hypothetical protein